MRHDIYTLPEIVFVAGQSNTLRLRLFHRGKTPYNAKGCSGNFSAVDYFDQTGDPLISKSLSFAEGEDGITNIATVDLAPDDTLALDGKYIYQITIKDAYGGVEIPNQGFLLITHNINCSYLK